MPYSALPQAGHLALCCKQHELTMLCGIHQLRFDGSAGAEIHCLYIGQQSGAVLCYLTLPMPTMLSFCRFGIRANTPAVSPSSIMLASASA